MKQDIPDIDIDVNDRPKAISGLSFINASMLQENQLRKHPTGLFFQNIPIDPITNLAVFPSGEKGGNLSDEMGFYKIDVIPNTAYQYVKSPDHLKELVERETDWELLQRQDVVEKLQHINNHYDIISAYGPDNIPDLACLIALIRPGKRYLIGEDWPVLRNQIWKKEGEQYVFKKSHAIAFSMMITVQMKSMQDAGLF